MDIRESIVDDVVVIELSGRLWGEPEGDNLSEILNTLKTKGRRNVVIDLHEVSLMNSSGLGSLIAGMKSLREGGGDLKLVNVNDRIMTILRITKLHQVFETYGSKEEAVQSFTTT